MIAYAKFIYTPLPENGSPFDSRAASFFYSSEPDVLTQVPFAGRQGGKAGLVAGVFNVQLWRIGRRRIALPFLLFFPNEVKAGRRGNYGNCK